VLAGWSWRSRAGGQLRPGGWGTVAAAAEAKVRDRLRVHGVEGYFALPALLPIFELSLAYLIYGPGPLLQYVAIAMTAGAFIYSAVFYLGLVLDRERVHGTLVHLFLAPGSRVAWMVGYALVGVLEAGVVAVLTLAFATAVLGVPLAVDLVAVAVTAALFLPGLWGLGTAVAALGLVAKRANVLANLMFPFITLLGGLYYPVDRLPDWLRYPALVLPFGYGTKAFAEAALHGASVRELGSQLLPLAGFAVALPALGVLAFRWVERLVRRRGELDLY
jgi:ABC-2 type transport system permease protein